MPPIRPLVAMGDVLSGNALVGQEDLIRLKSQAPVRRKLYGYIYLFLFASFAFISYENGAVHLMFLAALCGVVSFLSLVKYGNAQFICLHGSRIFVENTNISVHLIEIAEAKIVRDSAGHPSQIILRLEAARLFWVPGTIIGLFTGVVFNPDADTSDLVAARIEGWLRDRRADPRLDEGLHAMTFIRPATKQDAPLLANILNPIIERGGTTAYEEPVDAAYFETMMANLGPRDTLFVAEDDGRIVGYQLLEASPNLPANVASIASFVAIGTTAKGIGQAMAAETIRSAKAAGWAQIDATIRADNEGGLAYYARLGFVDHKVFAAVPLKDGTPVDRIAKRLTLA